MTKTTWEKNFSPCTSLSNHKHRSHLKMSLAEDYRFSLRTAPGFVLRLPLSRGRTPCPDSAWPWFTSSSNMPACLSHLIKGQDNSSNNRSRRVKRPCLLCEIETLERIFKRQMRQQRFSEHRSACQWWRRQTHKSLGPLLSRPKWEKEQLCLLWPETEYARVSGRQSQKEGSKQSDLFLFQDGSWRCSVRCSCTHIPQLRSLTLARHHLVARATGGGL